MFRINAAQRLVMSVFTDGGDGGGGSTPPAAPPATPTPADVANRTQDRAAENTPGSSAPGSNDGGETPPAKTEWERSEQSYRDEIKRLREENASKRVANKDQLNAIAAALGIETETTPTVDSVTATLTETRTELDTARADADTVRREFAAYRAAAQCGANPDALLDSVKFTDALKKISIDDTDALQQAIKDAVDANPALALSPAGASASAADFATGGSGTPNIDGLTMEQVVAEMLK